MGLTRLHIRAAVEHAGDSGAKTVEGYPMTNLPPKRRTVGEAFMEFSTTFEELGFEQVSERSRVRSIWRFQACTEAAPSSNAV